ncbi:hypothetical protein D1AOALGA4SA_12292 [Olavius algarvensis Delta 1 endosymbiont]|nr:hypothetical protein D1AOALGA4SA_12292 [Olavius algarvensis Delta 1 endosymbiont]
MEFGIVLVDWPFDHCKLAALRALGHEKDRLSSERYRLDFVMNQLS